MINQIMSFIYRVLVCFFFSISSCVEHLVSPFLFHSVLHQCSHSGAYLLLTQHSYSHSFELSSKISSNSFSLDTIIGLLILPPPFFCVCFICYVTALGFMHLVGLLVWFVFFRSWLRISAAILCQLKYL